MDYLKKNFEALREFRPDFFERIKDQYGEEYSEEGIEELDTRDGHKALCIERNGEKVRLNSLFHPIQEAEKWADQYNYQNLRIPVFMFGMGNGIFLRELLKRLKDDAVVFLVEPDVSVFLYQLVHQDFLDIITDERVLFFVKTVNDDTLWEGFDQNFHWSMISSKIVCRHPGYDRLYQEDCLKFNRDIDQGIELAMVNANTLSYMSRDIPINILRNLHFIKDSNYSGEFHQMMPENVPIIIVSAGPSLDKNIEDLKKAVGKAFIFATDTAVKYLLQHQVPFDMIMTLDAKKSPKHLSSPECAGFPLMCALEARNQLLEFHTGRKIWLRTGIYIEKLYEKLGRVFPVHDTGGSVATACYAVGVAMGAKRIILVGQDLAYSGEKTHAGGVTKHVKNEEYVIKMIEGIDGNQIRSRGDWVVYRDWFERVVKLEDAPDVIDATEGGALIKGTRIMTLSEAIEQYCQTPFDFKKILEEMPPTFNDKEYLLIQRECNKLEHQFTQIRQKATEAIKIANDLKKLMQSKNASVQKNKKVAKLRKINEYIQDQEADDFLEIYTSVDTAKDIRKINIMTDDEDKNMMHTLEISFVVYKSVINAVDDLRPILEESLRKM